MVQQYPGEHGPMVEQTNVTDAREQLEEPSASLGMKGKSLLTYPGPDKTQATTGSSWQELSL